MSRAMRRRISRRRRRCLRGDLVVRVSNTAPKGCDPATWGGSVGLASVRARIEESCPVGSGVEFTKTVDGLAQAEVRIKAVA